MIKVTLLLAGLLALGTAAVLRADDTEPVHCLYPDELWGSADGTKFYFCLPDTDIVITQDCPANTFFVRNTTVSGCLPLDVVNPNCVNTIAETPQPCAGEYLRHPQPSTDMNKFYLCTGEGAEPLLLPCATGMAFLEMNGYLGCFPWNQWRELRGCAESS